MAFTDYFKKKQKVPEFDPIKDLTLSKLKVGYLLDYDLKTWEVTGHNVYDWDSEFSEEWELTSGNDLIFLEMEKDDSSVLWCLSSKAKLSDLDRSIIANIKREEDPPAEIIYKTKKYYLVQSSAGYFLKDGKGDGQELITWDYEDEDEEHFITITQWGEDELELTQGFFVKEYEFTNILPRKVDANE